MADELEPLQEDLASLVRALPKATLSPETKARLVERIAGSAVGVPAAATGAVVGKLGVGLALAGLVVGGGLGAALDRALTEPRVIERVVVQVVDRPVPAPAQPLTETPAGAPPPPRLSPKVPRAPAVVSNEERQLVEAARTALIKRDAPAALNAIANHRARFPKGQFAEERDALEVQALAHAERHDEARAAAQAFHRAYPDSVFGPAVDSALAPR